MTSVEKLFLINDYYSTIVQLALEDDYERIPAVVKLIRELEDRKI